MPVCEKCGGTGFEIVVRDDREFAKPCACRVRGADAGDLLVDLCELGTLLDHQGRQLHLPSCVFGGLLGLGADGGDGSAQLVDEGHGVDSR